MHDFLSSPNPHLLPKAGEIFSKPNVAQEDASGGEKATIDAL